MTRIFISYRQESDGGHAGRLADRLKRAFGNQNVFMDVSNISPGDDLNNIFAWIERCDVFIVLLSKRLLEQINNPENWVHRETVHALEQEHIRVIPVLLGDAIMPNAADLPADLHQLLNRRALRLTQDLFDETVDKLIKQIRPPINLPARLMIGGVALAVVIGVILFAASNLLNPPEDNPGLTVGAPTSTESSSPTAAATDPPILPAIPTLTVPPPATATDPPTLTPTPTLTPSETAIPLGMSLDNPVTSNNQWTLQFQTFDGVEMALVPAGCFMMGENGEGGEQCFEPFWIDRYEVTNDQYGSIGCEDWSSEPDQPRNCVNWTNAKAHCERRAARLPTEAEWEYAARGPDALVYPWGNEFEAENAVYYDNSGSRTAAVGSRVGGVSWVGAYDLSGNVWEWVSTIFDSDEFPYPYATDDGREDINRTDARRVLRGGSFLIVGNLRAAVRFTVSPDLTSFSFGFRCARSS